MLLALGALVLVTFGGIGNVRADDSVVAASATPTAPPSAPDPAAKDPKGAAPSGPPPTYSYPQPPIPAQTVSADPASFTVCYDKTSEGRKTRHYDFDLGYSAGAPGGFLRQMKTINNQFPGPLIEANQGDTVEVTVNNRLDTPQSIHWHGIQQNGTNHMDGVPGITQCPIPPGGSYTYRFTLEHEGGTFWYHSHFGNTMTDGLVGGIVVHPRHEPLRDLYDDDRVLYFGDWYNDQTEVIVEEFLKGGPQPQYRGGTDMADAILINGIGQVNCSVAQEGVPCTQTAPAEVAVTPEKRTRLRLVNHGNHLIRLSIDGHELTIVEVDDQPVKPVSVREIPVWSGERYSVIVTADQGQSGNAFWIRAAIGAQCILKGTPMVGKAVLRYTSAGGDKDNHHEYRSSYSLPDSKPWPDLKDPMASPCLDLTEEGVSLLPWAPNDVPQKVYQTSKLDSSLGRFVGPDGKPKFGFGMNGVLYTNYINNPLLNQLEDGAELNNRSVAAITFPHAGAVDVLINQLDPFPLSHPFHIHGRPFYIVARGAGNLTLEQAEHVPRDTINALRRDTFAMSSATWAILRIPMDTPGVWAIHCHIGWHLVAGKLAVFVVRPDDIRHFPRPDDWNGLCAGTDINAIGPGRRAWGSR